MMDTRRLNRSGCIVGIIFGILCLAPLHWLNISNAWALVALPLMGVGYWLATRGTGASGSGAP